jgi:hypothetical protein
VVKADMATLFGLLRHGSIHPVVIDRLPLAAASEVHARIDAGTSAARSYCYSGPHQRPITHNHHE